MWPSTPGTDLLVGLRRRWWLIVGLPALTALLTVARPPTSAPTVEARLTVAVDVQPDARAADGSVGTAAEVGEALLDDLSRILPGDAFATAVTARLPAGTTVEPGEIQGSVSAEDRHRVTDITVRRTLPTGGRADVAAGQRAVALIAAAVGAELSENGGRWSSRLGADGAAFSVVDGPRAAIGPRPLTDRLALPLRTMVALLIALALAAALHASDARLRTSGDATAATRAPLLATVPRHVRSGFRSTKDKVRR